MDCSTGKCYSHDLGLYPCPQGYLCCALINLPNSPPYFWRDWQWPRFVREIFISNGDIDALVTRLKGILRQFNENLLLLTIIALAFWNACPSGWVSQWVSIIKLPVRTWHLLTENCNKQTYDVDLNNNTSNRFVHWLLEFCILVTFKII